jgi:hypothetical protein
MQGKKFMVSATWNAPREAFDNPQGVLYGGKGTADVFLNITANYKFCGYEVLPDFGVAHAYTPFGAPWNAKTPSHWETRHTNCTSLGDSKSRFCP